MSGEKILLELTPFSPFLSPKVKFEDLLECTLIIFFFNSSSTFPKTLPLRSSIDFEAQVVSLKLSSS